ncbi:SusC/RagA family TonB-linked outer membrane protein [Sinomicrobium weinanense]|uniref:TonB-dependent receptor n=1 Tax=Sinomicrobium weinanense TaxID=2842200 RepID=A0A926JPJ5_9FLAO|nr:TonB-dependent receptor [Sinomicrobium weinanense]MBC9794958.1 TonB-dependent receptor [Sinomicrobium weinanense]MBU3125181.1 TonB-dependent receptor [Sinomicrobium weinanense]
MKRSELKKGGRDNGPLSPGLKKGGHITTLLFLIFAFCGFSSDVFAQQREISGSVSDQDNVPLPGATILVKGTARGTQTDFDGQFNIMVDPGDILVFSYMGYVSEEIPVQDRSTINVALQEDLSVLDEVVVTGYGKQSRAKLTTSVSKLDTRILETSTRSNAATALQGTIAGLRVTNTTGQPGSTPEIILRGGTSFDGSGSPLILIDGIPGSFYALNADDIESIEVLKDAAATAIYGARSANGVILVTTKTGKVGRSSINYKQKYSMNYKRETPEYLGAADFIKYNRQAVQYYREATNNPNGFAAFLDGPTAFGTGGNTTNSPFTVQYLTENNRYLLNRPGWSTMADPLDPARQILFLENDVSDNIYQSSQTTDHYLSFDGGNEKGTYYLGLGYLDNEGLILGSGFKRYSGKFSGSYQISDKFRVNSNILYSHSNLNRSPLGNDDTVFRRFAGQAPTSRTYNNNEDGSLSDEYNPGTNSGFGNPLYYQDKFIRENIEQRLSASVGMDWDIMSDLTLSLKGSHFTINNHNESFNKAYLNGSTLITTRNASTSLERTLRNQLTGTLNYAKSFGEHNFDLLLGAEYYKDNIFLSSAGTKNSPTDFIYTLNAGSEANGVPSSFKSENIIVSTFGRLNYDFKDKYLVSLTFRRDGSSRLGNEKFGFFPGASIGWNVHKEGFFMDSPVSKVISNLKPRLSYGVNGNLASLVVPGQADYTANYVTFGSYGSQGIYDGQTGYANTGLPTPDLQWERSTTFNMGLDISFFKNRINIIADYFIRDVEDKISDLTLPYWTGFGSIRTNNGILRNKGLELQLNADIIRNEDFSWNVNGSVSHIKSFVQQLPDNDNELNRQGGSQIYNPNTGELEWVGGLQEGQRVGTDLVVTYEQDYIYADQAEVDAHAGRQDELLPDPTKRYPGDVAWVDVNNDDVINSYDRKVIGRTTPDFIGGLSTNLKYKNFGLFVKTDFATGHVIYNHIRGKGLAQTQGNLNQDALVLDSWTPENRHTDIPRFVFVDAQRNIFRGSEAVVNSHFWEKGDYLALREVTLSYDLPTEVFKDKINRLRLYVTGSNLHYFKSYSGDTPERGGYQYGEFPVPRTFTVGLDLTF